MSECIRSFSKRAVAWRMKMHLKYLRGLQREMKALKESVSATGEIRVLAKQVLTELRELERLLTRIGNRPEPYQSVYYDFPDNLDNVEAT